MSVILASCTLVPEIMHRGTSNVFLHQWKLEQLYTNCGYLVTIQKSFGSLLYNYGYLNERFFKCIFYLIYFSWFWCSIVMLNSPVLWKFCYSPCVIKAWTYSRGEVSYLAKSLLFRISITQKVLKVTTPNFEYLLIMTRCSFGAVTP